MAVRRLGLAIAVAGLLGAGGIGTVAIAPAAHADGDDLELQVTGEGVGFDGRDVSGDVWLQYTVRPPRSDNIQGFGHRVSRAEQRAGWVSFREAAKRFPGGYCVAWLQLENTQWGSWRQDKQACWLPKATAEDGDEAESESGSQGDAPAESQPKPSTNANPDQDTSQDQPDEEPSQAESTQESASPEPTPPPPSVAPTPSATPSASPSPSSGMVAADGDAAQDALESFARPESAGEYERPSAVDLTWLWVVLGGFAAAAGGVVITVMRRPM